MTILHILNHFLPHQTAGTEVYTWALGKHLQQLGADVRVVIPYYGKVESADYMYDGLPVHQYAEPTVVNRALIMGTRIPDGLKYFEYYLQREQPHIVHFHELAGSNGITMHHVRAAKASGAKVVMTFHLAGYSCITGTLVYKGEKLCNGKIDTLCCSTCYLHAKGHKATAPFLAPFSTFLAGIGINTTTWNNRLGTALGTARLIERTAEQLRELTDTCDALVVLTTWYREILLRNGVDENKIVYIPQALPVVFEPKSFKRKEGTPLNLIFLGRISPFKGLHLLLEALRSLDESQVSLDIYGQSNATDSEYLERCFKLAEGRSNIRWRGLLPSDKVGDTLQHYDALCLCSTFSEMSPLVIQEAFAAGIPVIASHVYGNAEQIKHGENGLLFRFNDVESLRQIIERCIWEPLLLKRLAQNTRPPADFSTAAKAYDQLYQKLSLQS